MNLSTARLPRALREFSRFFVVGGLAFLVDAGVLQICLLTTNIGPYWGRVLSYATAATFAWLLHRSFTFPHSRDAARFGQWFRFVVLNGLGGLLNYAVYAALVYEGGIFADYPVLAVAVGSLVAMMFNFVVAKVYIFRARPT